MLSNKSDTNSKSLLASLVTLDSQFGDIQELLAWIKMQNKKVNVKVDQIPFKSLINWSFRSKSLKHKSGKFFSIDGIRVKTNFGLISEWEQPIINQAEIGYLGFITREIDGILFFLLQAKIEPGNLNSVQLSPTLQATKSNYTQVHKGQKPHYLEYFQNVRQKNILLDQLQSEQGSRFLKKRNRNIIIRVQEELNVIDNYKWATLGQIKELMKFDNVVNMDVRTVISGLPFDDLFIATASSAYFSDFSGIGKEWFKSYVGVTENIYTMNSIISKITKYKSIYELDVKKIDLLNLKEWNLSDESISHSEDKYFKVIAANIKIDNREIVQWTQPLIKPQQEGLCAFIVKKINGIMHFIVQAKLECGNFDIIEFAPTVQCLTGNYNNLQSKSNLPFLDYVLNADRGQIIFDSYQSEEGGRFFEEQNRNVILIADDKFDEKLPERYIWMSLNQIQQFIQFNNYMNIQSRSLLAALSFVNND